MVGGSNRISGWICYEIGYCSNVLVAAAARVYIVVESFISLRHVPIGVYQTPDSNFMDYVPHL